MANSISCNYSCFADRFVPIGLWLRMATVDRVDDDRTCFTLCYRRIKNSNIHSIPIFVRQSTQTILDVVWARPTASSNSRDCHMVSIHQ